MKWQNFLLMACFTFTPVVTLDAQVGRESGLWTFTREASRHHSIVQVSAGVGTGTGVVIKVDKSRPIKDGYEGYCLTAWHVVENIHDNSIKIRFSNGRRAKNCRVIASHEETDVALVWAWIPDGIKPVELAPQPVKGGDKLEFAGLGGGSELTRAIRHFSATASSPCSVEKIFADVPLLPGDSGGPVFNDEGQLVGIISGGWFWYDGGVKLEIGGDIKATWPARASNIQPIRILMAELDDGTEEY